MRLIEKKCPGCGASIKIDENAKKGVCEYCKKEFIVEEDAGEKILSSFNEISTGIWKSTSFVVIGVIAFMFFMVIIIITMTSRFHVNNDSTSNVTNIIEEQDKDELMDEIVISNSDYTSIDNSSKSAILDLTFGDHNYQRYGTEERVKEYLLTKKDANIYIPVYKVNYQDWPNKEHKFTVYIPVKYTNVLKKGKSIDIFELGSGKIDADEYYFNLEHSSSTRGYQSLDELYEKYIKEYEEEYKIKQK